MARALQNARSGALGARTDALKRGALVHIGSGDDEVVGYEFINLGKMMEFIKKGDEAGAALEKAKGHYGQFDNAAKYIDPRQD